MLISLFYIGFTLLMLSSILTHFVFTPIRSFSIRRVVVIDVEMQKQPADDPAARVSAPARQPEAMDIQVAYEIFRKGYHSRFGIVLKKVQHFGL